MAKSTGKILALAGGVGGAKLALGLAGILPANELMVAVNTADDFEHLGLAISPDLDTVMYTLAGLDDPRRGWGRRNETWTFMSALAYYDGYRSPRLPANLLQAQRDYFGAHTYERADQPRGHFFHLDWPHPNRPQIAIPLPEKREAQPANDKKAGKP